MPQYGVKTPQPPWQGMRHCKHVVGVMWSEWEELGRQRDYLDMEGKR